MKRDQSCSSKLTISQVRKKKKIQIDPGLYQHASFQNAISHSLGYKKHTDASKLLQSPKGKVYLASSFKLRI